MPLLRQVWAILLPEERQRAFLALALMLAATAVEMHSVCRVVPVLAFMTSDATALPTALGGLIACRGDATSPRAVIVVLLYLVFIDALKSAFVSSVTYWQARYVRSISANVSHQLFAAVIDDDAVERALTSTRPDDFIRSLPDGIDTEHDVMAAVETLRGTKTLIIVAHRLSTVAQRDMPHRVEADRIIRSGAFGDVVAAGSDDAGG